MRDASEAHDVYAVNRLAKRPGGLVRYDDLKIDIAADARAEGVEVCLHATFRWRVELPDVQHPEA